MDSKKLINERSGKILVHTSEFNYSVSGSFDEWWLYNPSIIVSGVLEFHRENYEVPGYSVEIFLHANMHDRIDEYDPYTTSMFIKDLLAIQSGHTPDHTGRQFTVDMFGIRESAGKAIEILKEYRR